MICDKVFNAIQSHFDWNIMAEHNFLAPNVTSLCSLLKNVLDQFKNKLYKDVGKWIISEVYDKLSSKFQSTIIYACLL